MVYIVTHERLLSGAVSWFICFIYIIVGLWCESGRFYHCSRVTERRQVSSRSHFENTEGKKTSPINLQQLRFSSLNLTANNRTGCQFLIYRYRSFLFILAFGATKRRLLEFWLISTFVYILWLFAILVCPRYDSCLFHLCFQLKVILYPFKKP